MNVEQPERDRLKALRDKRGWTQKQLADRAGLSPAAISNFESSDTSPESSRTKHPRKIVYAKIVRALRAKDAIPPGDQEEFDNAFQAFVEVVSDMTLDELVLLTDLAKKITKST